MNAKNLDFSPVIPETEDPETALKRLVHEFKHPITAIKGHAILILQAEIDDQEKAVRIREIAEGIYSIAKNMETIQDAVFDYLRKRGAIQQ